MLSREDYLKLSPERTYEIYCEDRETIERLRDRVDLLEEGR